MAGTVIYLYTKFNQSSILAEHIPMQANEVVYVNSKKLAELFFSGRLKPDSFSKQTYSNPYLKRIPDLKRTGINLLADAAYIKYNSYQYVLVSLNDAPRFENTIKAMGNDLFDQALDMNSYKKILSKKDSFTIAWTSDRMVIIPKNNPLINGEFLNEILHIKTIHSFAKHSHFLNIKKEDALLWFYSQNIAFKISNPAPIKGYLNFDTSIVIIGTENIKNPYSLPLFYEVKNAPTNFIYADNANPFINKNLSELSTLFLPEESEKIKAINYNNYNKVLCLLGSRPIEDKQITYQYDENFNKTKIETLHIDTIQVATLMLNSLNKKENINISNDIQFKSYSPFNMQTVPKNVKLIAHINKDFMSNIFPTHFNYELKFIQQQDNGFNTYRLELKASTIKAFLQSL